MDFEKDILHCLEVLKVGGIILYPTDTVWGIGCDATNTVAVEKIFRLKKRSDEKAMIVLVADERDIIKYVTNPDLRVFEYLEKQSKPVTVVYDGAIELADNLVGKDGTIAIRICKETFCKHLIKRFRKPIVSTSANSSGQPAPGLFKYIDAAIRKAVDYVVEYRQDEEIIAAPSSVIKWNKDATVTILRP